MTVAMATAGWEDTFDMFCLISLEVKGFRRSCWYPRLGNLLKHTLYKFETLAMSIS